MVTRHRNRLDDSAQSHGTSLPCRYRQGVHFPGIAFNPARNQRPAGKARTRGAVPGRPILTLRQPARERDAQDAPEASVAVRQRHIATAEPQATMR